MPTFSTLPGFRVLPEADRGAFDRQTRALEVRRGQVLFSEGDTADSIWAVAEGKVHIVKSGPEGREIVLEVVAPGELFGAVVAIAQRPYPASAIAADDGVVWRLAASTARDLCHRYPTLHNAIMEQVAARLRGAHERLRSVALERVEQRLARVLIALTKKIGVDKGAGMAIAVTRQELADMTGTTVETAIRVTSRWAQLGVIASSRNEIRIIDAKRFAAIAQGQPAGPPAS